MSHKSHTKRKLLLGYGILFMELGEYRFKTIGCERPAGDGGKEGIR